MSLLRVMCVCVLCAFSHVQYRSHVAAGTFSTTLDALYKYGWEVSWKLDGGFSA